MDWDNYFNYLQFNFSTDPKASSGDPPSKRHSEGFTKSFVLQVLLILIIYGNYVLQSHHDH